VTATGFGRTTPVSAIDWASLPAACVRLCAAADAGAGNIVSHAPVARSADARERRNGQAGQVEAKTANFSAWRRATSGDLTAAFGYGEPPRLDLPSLSDTRLALRL
jgi:hypothetical protein